MTPTTALLALPSPAHFARSTALKPIAAGSNGAPTDRGPDIDAEALREEELRRLGAERTDSQSTGAGTEYGRFRLVEDDEKPEAAGPGEKPFFPGTLATFLAQLYSQNLPGDQVQDPFGDASRAYDRLSDEHIAQDVFNGRHPVDFAA